MGELSKSQIDQLGDRLRDGPPSDDDLRMLDEFRESFSDALERVRTVLRHRQLEPTVRKVKSRLSITEKLRRQDIRLSRMQDIAGCRLVVVDILAQNSLVDDLLADFPEAKIRDRREEPSHGYRAVHVIAKVLNKPLEIQVRSLLQHSWAELSEKAADILDQSVKYGGGPPEVQAQLSNLSAMIAGYETKQLESGAALPELQPNSQEQLQSLFATIPSKFNVLANLLERLRKRTP